MRYRTGPVPMIVIALVRLVAVATIREWRLFCSVLAQVQLLFESGVYSRAPSIRSYTVVLIRLRNWNVLVMFKRESELL